MCGTGVKDSEWYLTRMMSSRSAPQGTEGSLRSQSYPYRHCYANYPKIMFSRESSSPGRGSQYHSGKLRECGDYSSYRCQWDSSQVVPVRPCHRSKWYAHSVSWRFGIWVFTVSRLSSPLSFLPLSPDASPTWFSPSCPCSESYCSKKEGHSRM